MTRPFVYANAARDDLREILRYTNRRWGATQARAYARQLDEAAAALAAGQGAFKDWSELLPGLRVKAAGSHFIFGVIRPQQPTLILAVLHQRMDLLARLQSRLPGPD